jgi:hypothetical protein
MSLKNFKARLLIYDEVIVLLLLAGLFEPLLIVEHLK